MFERLIRHKHLAHIQTYTYIFSHLSYPNYNALCVYRRAAK